MAIAELNRFPEEAMMRGKDLNRLCDLLLGNDGAQVKLLGHDGTVKDPHTGATSATGAYTQVVQNTGGNHVAVLLAATAATATPSTANSVLLVQDAGLSIGNGKELRLSNAAGTNTVTLAHSGTTDVAKLTGSLVPTTTATYDLGSTTPLAWRDLFLSRKAFIGATSNGVMTVGLTIDQGAADDEVLNFQSSDVAHGIIAVDPTSTFGAFLKTSATDGGMKVRGLTEATSAVQLQGLYTTDNTTRATTAVAAVEVAALKKSGTAVGAPGANANLFGVLSEANMRFLVDQEGDIHMDATSNINVWDDEPEDVALLEAFRLTTMRDDPPSFRRLFADDIATHAETLARTGVITLNEDGHHFFSLKGVLGLTMDSIRQTYGRLRETQQRVDALERRLLALEAP